MVFESLESWFGFLGQRSRNESCRMQVDASGMRQRMVASGFLHSMEEQQKVWTQRAQTPFWPLIRATGETVWDEGPEQRRYVM